MSNFPSPHPLGLTIRYHIRENPLSITFTVETPLCPYGVAHRRTFGSSTSGLLKESLCRPLRYTNQLSEPAKIDAFCFQIKTAERIRLFSRRSRKVRRDDLSGARWVVVTAQVAGLERAQNGPIS